MSTNRITNTGIPNSLGALTNTDKTEDAAKAKAATSAPQLPVPTPAVGGKVGAAAAGVKISPDAKERAEAQQKALKIARDTPDVREDRVAELKKQIQAGTYQIDSGKIADGMLREAIKDHLATDG